MRGRLMSIALMIVLAASVGSAETRAPESPSPAPAAAPKRLRLEGKRFVGQLGLEDATEGQPDELIFEHGTFASTVSEPHGFVPAPYQSSQEGDAVHFSATATSATEGTMTWDGLWKGEELEGTVLWERPNQDPESYWFKTKLKPVILTD